MAVTYTNYSDDGVNIIYGTQSATQTLPTSPFGTTTYTWHDNLTLTGCRSRTEVTTETTTEPGWVVTSSSIGGSTRTGTLTTTIDGVSYTSPPTGT